MSAIDIERMAKTILRSTLVVMIALNVMQAAAYAQPAGGGGGGGGGGGAAGALDNSDSNPGTAWDIRKNYFKRYKFAKEFGPTEHGGADNIDTSTGESRGTGSVKPKDIAFAWPKKVQSQSSTVPTKRDEGIMKYQVKTFGYPVSDTQFQIIQRLNDNMMLEEAFDPERWMWMENAMGAIKATSAANSMANLARNQASGAIQFSQRFLKNFTVDEGNQWNRIRNELFIPMAFLLLLPGAVLAQVRAIVAQGSPVLGNVNPFDGIIRSIIAIFFIPATYLVVNYGIDVSNSIAHSIALGYHTVAGGDMYKDAQKAQERAFPIRKSDKNKNQIPAQDTVTNTATGGASTDSFAQLESISFDVGESDTAGGGGGGGGSDDGKADEVSPILKSTQRLVVNGANAGLSATWNVLCAFQMAYLYYLFCIGPVVAALWVWPMNQLRQAFPSWVEGVVTLCFWSLFWHTTILLMACFKDVGTTGTVIMTALNFLATASVKHAFDFAGLIKAAGEQAGKAAQGGGAGGKGGGQKGGGQQGADSKPGTSPQPTSTDSTTTTTSDTSTTTQSQSIAASDQSSQSLMSDLSSSGGPNTARGQGLDLGLPPGLTPGGENPGARPAALEGVTSATQADPGNLSMPSIGGSDIVAAPPPLTGNDPGLPGGLPGTAGLVPGSDVPGAGGVPGTTLPSTQGVDPGSPISGPGTGGTLAGGDAGLPPGSAGPSIPGAIEGPGGTLPAVTTPGGSIEGPGGAIPGTIAGTGTPPMSGITSSDVTGTVPGSSLPPGSLTPGSLTPGAAIPGADATNAAYTGTGLPPGAAPGAVPGSIDGGSLPPGAVPGSAPAAHGIPGVSGDAGAPGAPVSGGPGLPGAPPVSGGPVDATYLAQTNSLPPGSTTGGSYTSPTYSETSPYTAPPTSSPGYSGDAPSVPPQYTSSPTYNAPSAPADATYSASPMPSAPAPAPDSSAPAPSPNPTPSSWSGPSAAPSMPGTPSYSAPSTPSYSQPSTPSYSAPPAPNYNAPSTPSYSAPAPMPSPPEPNYSAQAQQQQQDEQAQQAYKAQQAYQAQQQQAYEQQVQQANQVQQQQQQQVEQEQQSLQQQAQQAYYDSQHQHHEQAHYHAEHVPSHTEPSAPAPQYTSTSYSAGPSPVIVPGAARSSNYTSGTHPKMLRAKANPSALSNVLGKAASGKADKPVGPAAKPPEGTPPPTRTIAESLQEQLRKNDARKKSIFSRELDRRAILDMLSEPNENIKEEEK